MDSRAFELLIKLIDEQKKETHRRHDETARDLREIKEALDEIQKFRLKIIGGSLAVSALLSFGMHLISTFLVK